MLNRKQKKGILIGIWVTLGIILLYAVFVWPNFYGQIQRSRCDTITDVTAEERKIIEENVLFDLPKSAEINQITAPLRLLEPTFYMIFSIPAEEKKKFIQSFSDYYRHIGLTYEYDSIEVAGKNYSAIDKYERISYEFTGIYEYQEVDGRVYFQFYYTDYPDALDEIFYERIRIFPKRK